MFRWLLCLLFLPQVGSSRGTKNSGVRFAEYPLTQGATAWPAAKKPARTFSRNPKGVHLFCGKEGILSALPKMAQAAQSGRAEVCVRETRDRDTEQHVARLEKVFEEIDETPHGKTCDAIMGIIEEGTGRGAPLD